MSRKMAFVEETQFLMSTGWPSVQAELKKIVEVEYQEGDYLPAEFAAEEAYLRYGRTPGWKLRWGRNETSFRAESADERISYFSYREI